MKRYIRVAGLVISIFVCLNVSAYGQENKDNDLLNGFFVRGAYTSFSQAMIMTWNERDEFMLNQGKKMVAFGAGYAYKPNEFWAGFSASANFATTKLEPFVLNKYFDGVGSIGPLYMLRYNDISYSMLLFDCDALIFPLTKLPVALTVGFMLGSSFQSYSVSGDTEPYMMNANGSRSVNMFRYGYILGCKIVPFRFVSLDIEYRPMAAYTSTTHYSDYLYSKVIDGVKWDYFGSSSTSEGPSESMFLMGISVHF
jgi:hypothetical protein